VVALGVLQAADELGIRVPEELSVVGYDDISYAGLPRIELTTVAQPSFEMGRIAAEWLLSVLEGAPQRRLYRLLTPKLVVRRTTAPAGSG